MHQPRVAAAVLAAMLALGAGPAFAADDAPTTRFDLRSDFEYQSWNWASPSKNASVGFTTPMTTFTFVDHTGVLFGAALNVAKNESNRRMAEDDAIRHDQRTYTYTVEEAHAAEGTRFFFTVGRGGLSSPTFTGSGPNLANASTSMLMARLGVEGDVVELFDGVFVFSTSTGYWDAQVPGTATSSGEDVQAWNWPIQLRYRWSPRFLPGLVIEPEASFDWLWTLGHGVQGDGWNLDAHTFGVEAGYYLLPEVKLRAGYHLDRLGHNTVSWMTNTEVVDMHMATVGVTLDF